MASVNILETTFILGSRQAMNWKIFRTLTLTAHSRYNFYTTLLCNCQPMGQACTLMGANQKILMDLKRPLTTVGGAAKTKPNLIICLLKHFI